MMRATSEQWRACANVFAGHPAFILGNGPTLPKDLSPLKRFFTVGVNRIVNIYDPTALMWFDTNVLPDIEDALAKAETIPFVNEEINQGGRFNGLKPKGTTHKWLDTPLARPDLVVSSGNSGVAAAYWAMSLGCCPVYLLGMSARYKGGRTNYYGLNQHHSAVTLRQLRRAMKYLLALKNVYPIQTQGQLKTIAKAFGPIAKGRKWYLDRFKARHSGVYPGQQPKTTEAKQPCTIAEALDGGGEPDSKKRLRAHGHIVGRFERLRRGRPADRLEREPAGM